MQAFSKFCFIAALFFAAGSASAQVIAQATEQAQESKTQVLLDLVHYMPVKTSNDPLTVFTLIGNLKFSPLDTLSLTQAFTKLYYKDPNESEIQASDTTLAFSHKFFAKGAEPWGTNLSLVADTTLPASQFSREQRIYTTGLALRVEKKFLDDRLQLWAKPFYRQHFNAYKTMEKDDNGRFLVRSRRGVQADVAFDVLKSLTLDFGPIWTERSYEQPAYGSQPDEHDYTFTAAATYNLTEKTSFALGYSEANRAEQQGLVSVYLFDEESTQYYLEATTTF